MAKFEIYINSARGMEKTGSVAGSMEEAKAMIKSWGGNPNEYANYVIKTPDGKHVDYRDSAFTDEKWGVWKSGGAIGEKTNYFVVENLSEEEAKERAKGRNDRRSAGDKTYYKLKYTAKKMSDTEVADGRRLEYEDDLVVVKRGSEDVKVGQQYQNARLATLTVTNITNSGNVEWQFSRDGDVYGASVSGFKTMLAKNGYRKIKDSTKMFKVVDKATGKTLLVKATDSLAAVKRVSSLKDTAYTVTACTNDFPYGNNVAVIVDANSEDEAVAKYRKVIEARGDKINYISATPTTSSDIAKGISRFKN